MTKHYKSKTGGVLSLTRSQVINGARQALPPVEFDHNGDYYTSNERTQAWIENHPNYGSWFELVERRGPALNGQAKPADTKPADTEEKPEPKPDQETEPEKPADQEEKGEEKIQQSVDVKNINEALEYLKSEGIDTKGVRSWADTDKLAEQNGIVFNRDK